MFEKLKKYIDDNLILSEKQLREDERSFVLKKITSVQIEKFEVIKTKYNMNKWKLESFGLLKYWKGLDENGINEVKHNLVNDGLSLPNEWLDFLREFNGFCPQHFILFGHNDYGIGPTSVYFHRMMSFPKYIDKGFLNIGRYCEDDSPIFINTQGNIFVYSGEKIFKTPKFKPKKIYDMPLIAYWGCLEDFITEETKRYIDMFINEPYASTTADMLPHNVSTEIFDKLLSEGKIKRP